MEKQQTLTCTDPQVNELQKQFDKLRHLDMLQSQIQRLPNGSLKDQIQSDIYQLLNTSKNDPNKDRFTNINKRLSSMSSLLSTLCAEKVKIVPAKSPQITKLVDDLRQLNYEIEAVLRNVAGSSTISSTFIPPRY